MGILVHNPIVPFEHHLYEPFTHGHTLIIRGHSDYHSHHENRFEINLGVDPNHYENIALHVNPRLHPHKVILNSLINGEWGHEEHHHNHIHQGEHFEIRISAHHHHYEVHINGHHVCDYKYRIPSGLVNHISIRGGVHIESVALEHH